MPSLNFLATAFRLGKDPDATAKLGKAAVTAPLKAYEAVPRLIIRGLQFVLAVVVVGFYAHPMRLAAAAGQPIGAEWAYGVTVGSGAVSRCPVRGVPLRTASTTSLIARAARAAVSCCSVSILCSAFGSVR